SAAPASPYLAPSTSFPAYSPAPPQQFAHHSGPLQPYPPPAPHQQQAYPPHPQHAYPPHSQQHGYPPPSPSPYGYDPYPAYPSYPSPAHPSYPSPEISHSSSFHHQPHPSAPDPTAASYPSPAISHSSSFHHQPHPSAPAASYPSPAVSHSSSFHHQPHPSAPESPAAYYPSPAISPSSSFHHQPHPSAPESPAASALHYPIVDGFANMHLSGRHDYTPAPMSSPSVLPHSASFSNGGGMQMVPYGTVAGGSQHGSMRASLKVVLLHGSLDIWVHEAKNLPNKDMFSKRVSELLSVGGKSNSKMTSDPYVTIQVSYATVARTYVVSNSENPVWAQNFHVPVGHEAAEVEFVVKDSDVFGAQLMGTVAIPAENLLSGDRIEGIYPVLEPNGKLCAPGAVLQLSIQYIPVARLTMYHHGVIAGPDCLGVPNTYFPLRRGMRVTLYQDAHVPDGSLPDIWLDHGLRYQHGQCWRDMYNAISQARRLIYIVGWSVFHTIDLIRDGAEKAPSLGDLLKMKSQEGVRVLLLVWDDPTSRSILGFKMDGFMGTRDEETRRFFKHSSVQVLLCPRSAGKRHSWVKQQETGTIFTHHQKTVIVDADAGNYRRKIIAFVGGLDLCGGRYDTPGHPLFQTLQTSHKEDYYNPNFATVDARGPREPWHDLHSRIDGPAAYDVLKNFEERWLKASKRHGIKKLGKSNDDALLKIERIHDIVNIDDAIYFSDNDPETWHVQVFRSIDSNSAKGFPKDPRVATMKVTDKPKHNMTLYSTVCAAD
uniref:phospholipase D n=1 Tax=Aegilops tauschii subsp. strangulata TaxID=200361 RepID=A0A452YNY0_AEGTS